MNNKEFDDVIFQLIVEKQHKKYTISSSGSRGWVFYLSNQDNEGMTISSHDFFEIIDKYFKKYY